MAATLEELLKESRKLRNSKEESASEAIGTMILSFLLLPVVMVSHVFEAIAIGGLVLRLQWWWPGTFGPALPRAQVTCGLLVLSAVLGWLASSGRGRTTLTNSDTIGRLIGLWLFIGATYLMLMICR